MPPAARITDMHVCPMVTPGVPPIPHVGGPVSVGMPTVLIGMLPAARMGDMCVCVGPPDVIAKGSPTVLIGGQMAARMGDNTAHGGIITVGFPTVLIGEVGMGSPVSVSVPVLPIPSSPATPSSTPGGGPGAGSSAVMTEDEAAKWMQDFKDKRPDIPFDWPRDCCYTRAREMSKALAAEGRTPGKVWNYAPRGESLRANTSNVKEGYVNWRYHVAPTVPVRRKDGSVTDMVLDPSLTDKPLTPDEWKALQGKPGSTLEQTDAAPYYRDAGSTSGLPDPGDAAVQGTLAEHRANRAMEPK